MSVTIILTAHMKPTLGEALASVHAQTREDWECVIMDSGAWRGGDDPISCTLADLYRLWSVSDEPRFRWHFTEEPADIRQHKCPVSWATNEAIRRGLVTGDYVCTFYDDDLYYPTFIEKMAGYLDDHPNELAVWCSQDRLRLTREGDTQNAGIIAASHVLTPGMLDCRVDGGQVMFRREALDLIGDPWLPEEPGLCSHSDGVFLERLATVAGSISPLGETLLAHRFTPYSTFSPS